MKVDLMTLALAAISIYIGYYIYSQNKLTQEQDQVINDQNNLIETQRAYIIEINKIFGINNQFYFYQPNQKEDSPINNRPI